MSKDSTAPRRLIVNADDFGRSESINQAVIRAHREGILTTASLMVNEPAAGAGGAAGARESQPGRGTASGAGVRRGGIAARADSTSGRRTGTVFGQSGGGGVALFLLRPVQRGASSARSRRRWRSSAPPAWRWTTSTAICICICIRSCWPFSWTTRSGGGSGRCA